MNVGPNGKAGPIFWAEVERGRRAKLADQGSETVESATNKPIWNRWWFWAVIVVLLAAIASNSGSEDEPVLAASTTTTSTSAAEPEATTSSISTQPSEESTTSQPNDASGTSQPSEGDLPSYEIVEEEDVSFPGAVRVALRVTVEEGTTAEQLRALAASLVTEFRTSDEYQALIIWFYHYPELAFDITTLGRWEDAPYGDWGRANEVDRGDYSKHEPYDRVKEKDWTLLPTPDEVDLYLAYLMTFDEMDTGVGDLPDDDDVFAAVATEHGVNPADVEDAADAVLDWTFNG